MRSTLLIAFFFLSCKSFAQNDCLWMSPGFGVAFGKKSYMAHIDISATYLRYNRWGFSLNAGANGRTLSGSKPNSLKSYSGFSVQFAYNFIPYENSDIKLIGRAGITHGTGYLVKENFVNNLDSVVQNSANYTTEYASFGADLSIEYLFSHRDQRAWSLQFFTMITRHPFAGVCVRFSLGGF